jgi:SP family facilitated glucose transporter-like MFS transporter 12
MAASLLTMGIVNLNLHMNVTNICRSHSPVNQSLDEFMFSKAGDLSTGNGTLREHFNEITSTIRDSHESMGSDVDRRAMMASISLPNVGLSPTEHQIDTDSTAIPPVLKWLSLASLLVYVAAFSVGLGPSKYFILYSLPFSHYECY